MARRGKREMSSNIDMKLSSLDGNLRVRAEQRLDEFRRLRQAGLICDNGDFYPTGVHYPPIVSYPDLLEESLFNTYQLPADGKFDVYLHIPFCKSRCFFCHYPLKLGQHQQAEKDLYLSAIEREMDLYIRRLGLDVIPVRSILAGGGTPTFLTLDQQRRFLDLCASRMDLSECTQYNYDVDPVTILGPEGEQRLKLLRDYGVDRLTIGVQSLNDDVLKLMNRHHDAQTAVAAVQASLNLGFQVNIEFIFGYPGQTLESWVGDIERAVSLGTHEIQLYRLKIDAYGDYQGPVKTLIERQPDALPNNDTQIIMKAAAHGILEQNGFTENLRRVFSRKREHYSHYADNQCCKNLDEVGFGLTAFSSLVDRFGLNTQDWGDYYGMIEQGRLPVNRGLVRSPEEQARWATILPLKNRDIYKPRFEEVTGKAFDGVFRAKFDRLKEWNLVEETDTVMKLTPLGSFFADEVVQQFEHPRFLPFPMDAYGSGPLNPYRDNDTRDALPSS
jgi:oxygen-independent coproporphyrinogen III oxidase